MLDDMARHWEIFKNKSAVIVLDKYAEIGYYLATVFSGRYGVCECQLSEEIL